MNPLPSVSVAIELRGRELVKERPAALESFDVDRENVPQPLEKARAQARAGDVRGEDDVREPPQRVLWRQWIRVMRIERGARDPIFAQCPQQRLLLNDRPARGVEEVRR